MIDDQPTPLTLTVSKAEPRRERHWLALAYIGKGVIAAVDCNVSVDPDTVLPQLARPSGWGGPSAHACVAADTSSFGPAAPNAGTPSARNTVRAESIRFMGNLLPLPISFLAVRNLSTRMRQ